MTTGMLPVVGLITDWNHGMTTYWSCCGFYWKTELDLVVYGDQVCPVCERTMRRIKEKTYASAIKKPLIQKQGKQKKIGDVSKK